MTSPKAVTFCEIDIPYCALSYGVSPCTASGPIKCFNTYATSQDRENFSESIVTLRFAIASAYLDEAGIESVPSITGISYDPAVLSLGEKHLGTRAKLSVTFQDHPHGDTGLGFDKYFAERPYDPAKNGSFWGKFRARHPVLAGNAIRLIRGYVGQTIAQMDTRHLIIDAVSFETNGSVTITGKDILKLADGDRALAPRPSSGYLVGDISPSDTAATLSPAGIGNQDYPSSGYLSFGGQEIVAFTRTDDTLTLTRGQFNTDAVSHSAQDRGTNLPLL